MKNGEYELVKAPEGFPGKIYRGKYAYEHRIVWWQMTGELPEVIHHKNGDKRDNRFNNLRGMTREEHREHHGSERSVTMVDLTCPNCGIEFERARRKTHHVKPNKQTYCSRECVGADT